MKTCAKRAPSTLRKRAKRASCALNAVPPHDVSPDIFCFSSVFLSTRRDAVQAVLEGQRALPV
eukprot:3882792-Rhodomonas_salina.2